MRVLCGLLGLVGVASVAPPAFAESGGGPLRLAFGGSLGALAARPDPPIPRNQNGYSPVPFSAGIGAEGRIGVQLGPYVAVDAQLFGQTAVLTADARAALLLEVAPVRSFALGVGAGVGAMWTANFLFESPSANFSFGLARGEVRLDHREGQGGLVFGLEGVLGRTHRGSVPAGTQVIGGRAFFGMLFR